MSAHALAGAMFAGIGRKFAFVRKRLQRVQVGVDHQDHIAAMAAIAAIWPAAINVLFAPKVDDAIAAIA